MELVPPSDVRPLPGQFLLSEPFLKDPWFGRKTVFLCDHDSEGSLGFVLDNGMGRKLSEVLPDSVEWAIDHEVHRGGPVNADSLFYLHRLGERVSNSISVLPGLWLGGTFDDLVTVLKEGEVDRSMVRFFAGYAGWGAGQLEQEMEGSSWYVHDLPESQKLSVVMNASPGALWADMLRSKGPEYARVTGLPQDPSLN